MIFLKEYRQIKNNYRSLNFLEKFIIWLRFKITPISKILGLIPQRGMFLDLGCGFGTFSYFLSQKYPDIEIIGIDPSEERIKLANDVFLKPKNLRFYQGEIKDLVEKNFAVIILIDVEYLLSHKELIEILRRCYEKTTPDGILIIKTMNRARFFRHLLTISTPILIGKILSIFRFTIFGSRKRRPHYYHPKIFSKILEETGWRATEIYDLPMKFFIYPHIIYFCKKGQFI